MQSIGAGSITVPQLGQGTWQMGDSSQNRATEIKALQRGMDLGMLTLDTAELYGSGRSETLVGEALKGRREQAFLVTKVLPSNASRQGTIKACEASLKRLGTDTLDLYLLHWRGSHPLAETVAGFESLKKQGKIRHWGVSNFDVADMTELFNLEEGQHCAANQILYNPEYRGVEFDLLPWCEQHKVLVMAYSPVGQGGDLLQAAFLRAIASKHGVSTAQVALAWCLRKPLQAIPKAGSVAHVEDNAAAAELKLSAEDLQAIDAAYPAPTRKQQLSTL